MLEAEPGKLARVTYRATLADGREAGLEFALAPESATLADAWRRLTAVYGVVDPHTLEIEIRRRAYLPMGRLGRMRLAPPRDA